MKKKIFLIPFYTIGLFLSFSGCNETFNPGDGYIDSLPSSMADGVLLQAFGWSFNQIKANLPALKAAGFKGVQTSPVQQPKSGGAQWQFFYQPVSFSIADSSPLGTKEELISLCNEAETYDISIICDIVFNHVATTGQKDSNNLPIIDPEVENYEPTIYNNQTTYFHQVTSASGSGAVTQVYPGLPDLNTANSYIQERCLSLLKECIDAGVDGFRFDAAKHIETPDDPNCPSDFWPNTLEVAKNYYFENTGEELYAYGEILNGLDGGRTDLSIYTQFMKMTDNSYVNDINSGVSTDANKLANATFGKNTTANNLVTWVESHDTFISSVNHINEKKVAREWAVLASRKDTNCMYFARCDANQTVAKVDSYQFEKEMVGASNRFHNRFIGAEEAISTSGDCFINERYSEDDEGAVVINVKVTDKSKQTVTFSHLQDGVYFDELTSKTVNVKGGKATIGFNESGVAVLTHSHHYIRPDFNSNFYDRSYIMPFEATFTSSNFSGGYYQINDGEEKKLSGTTKVLIDGSSENIEVFIHLENHTSIYERTISYSLISGAISGYFNIFNLDESYLIDYELYVWAWTATAGSSWNQDYSYRETEHILLMDDVSSYQGFLLAIFPKNYVVTNLTKWDSKVIKQSSNIYPNDEFFDASSF